MRWDRLLTVFFLVSTGPAMAGGASVALVEDVVGQTAGVEFMDYVEPGQVIRLGPQDMIVLNYLYSCLRETITGGVITIGREHSDVQSGKVERNSTPCDTGRMLLTAQLASQSAATVVRSFEKQEQSKLPSLPQFVLYGLSPLIELRGGGGIVEISRLDKAGEHHVLKIGMPQSLRTAYYDFASEGKALSSGGVYRATLAGATKQSVTFKIDPSATPGKGPIAGRLLRIDQAI